jgi:urea transport system ATP-binding protein
MDIITGKTQPDAGDVIFDQTVDLTRHDEAAIAQMGIGRKFQRPTVFETHTVFDNLLLSLTGPRGVLSVLRARPTREERDRVEEVLDTIRLTARRDDLAAGLSHGQKQWLEIGMLLAQDPKVLLVDEPAAGMTDAETMHTAELLKRLAGAHTIMVVEHDMHFVRALESRVTVLHEGRVLAEGSLDHVSAEPEVIAVYLGR